MDVSNEIVRDNKLTGGKQHVLTEDDINVLEQHQFMRLPYSIWQELNKSKLNGTEKAIYVYLYHETEMNTLKHGVLKPALITKEKLRVIVNRKETAVNDAITNLKKHGWITVEQAPKYKSGAKQVGIYRVGMPLAAKFRALSKGSTKA